MVFNVPTVILLSVCVSTIIGHMSFCMYVDVVVVAVLLTLQ